MPAWFQSVWMETSLLVAVNAASLSPLMDQNIQDSKNPLICNSQPLSHGDYEVHLCSEAHGSHFSLHWLL
jgi:hypothetical protein